MDNKCEGDGPLTGNYFPLQHPAYASDDDIPMRTGNENAQNGDKSIQITNFIEELPLQIDYKPLTCVTY